MPRKPTRKQKRAAKIILENPSLTTAEVMRQAGYSDASIVDPNKNLLQTKGFAELLEEYLPDELLSRVHQEGLSSVKTSRDKFGDKYEDPDYYTRHAYLETAYKIKGKLNPKSDNDTGNITVQLVVYDQQNNPNSISVSAKRLSTSISESDGRRIQASGDSVASQEWEG